MLISTEKSAVWFVEFSCANCTTRTKAGVPEARLCRTWTETLRCCWNSVVHQPSSIIPHQLDAKGGIYFKYLLYSWSIDPPT